MLICVLLVNVTASQENANNRKHAPSYNSRTSAFARILEAQGNQLGEHGERLQPEWPGSVRPPAMDISSPFSPHVVVAEENQHPSPFPAPLVLAGPSGVGKSTLINMLMEYYPDNFGFSVSHTTRMPRPGEVNGVHYHFVSREEMESGIEAGDFVEWAEVHGNLYGTSFSSVTNLQAKGKVCILDIDIQGVQTIKKKSMLRYHYVFIAPPSMDELEKRLRDRSTESEEQITKRLKNAKGEIDYGLHPGNFEQVLVNDKLELTFSNLEHLLQTWYMHHLVPPEQASLQMMSAPLVFSGPSGVGKGALIEALLRSFPSQIGLVASHTTRPPRPGEKEGVHYHFVQEAEMHTLIEEGEFLEWTRVHGHYYGTSYGAVAKVQHSGRICVLDVNMGGAEAVKAALPSAHLVFVTPPDLGVLEQRLQNRNTESDTGIKLQVSNAIAEVEAGLTSGYYDEVLFNVDLQRSIMTLKSDMLRKWYPALNIEFDYNQEGHLHNVPRVGVMD